ncbi:MAG: deoxynucleoside kinase [Bacteroidetes bacterium]|nr:deoxynucleoside kinase [Bacteroidota bacterium]
MVENQITYIVIEGNIGAGKTTLATRLAEHMGAALVLEEFAENAFLPQFYTNPEKYGFPLELSFMAARYHQLRKTFEEKGSGVVVSDYHFHKSKLFASVNLDPAELELYQSFFHIVSAQIPEPQLLVYLDKDIQTLQKNIRKRGRPFETAITDEYLNKITGEYQRFLETQKKSRVLKLDTNNSDFIANENDFKTIVNAILSHSY